MSAHISGFMPGRLGVILTTEYYCHYFQLKILRSSSSCETAQRAETTGTLKIGMLICIIHTMGHSKPAQTNTYFVVFDSPGGGWAEGGDGAVRLRGRPVQQQVPAVGWLCLAHTPCGNLCDSGLIGFKQRAANPYRTRECRECILRVIFLGVLCSCSAAVSLFVVGRTQCFITAM